mgnify:CR=1 FL=1
MMRDGTVQFRDASSEDSTNDNLWSWLALVCVCCLLGELLAQGKSNLLEAISLLATGKSFRAARESDLVRSATPLARVAAKVRTRAHHRDPAPHGRKAGVRQALGGP